MRKRSITLFSHRTKQGSIHKLPPNLPRFDTKIGVGEGGSEFSRELPRQTRFALPGLGRGVQNGIGKNASPPAKAGGINSDWFLPENRNNIIATYHPNHNCAQNLD